MTSLHRSLCCVATLLALSLPAAASADEQVRVWHEQALAHEHGTGVERNMDTALELYCKAALAGDVRAIYRMGWIYTNGRGVERNDAFAAYLFQQAAGLGDEVSRNMLSLVGSQTAKPPCTVQAEAEEARRQAEVQAAADMAATQAAQEAATNRYKTLIDSAQKKDIMAIVRRLAPQYGIHPGLAFAVIRAESNFDPLAISDKNAQGLMQLIPETAARFNVRQPLDPEQNIRGGLAYLRWLLAYFKGDVPLAVAAYNAGEGAVNRYGGVPPFKETQGYLRRIQEVFSLPEHPFDPRITAPSPMLTKPSAPPRL
jgi:soluble lytic murein transglycosylase-like protein